MINKTTFVNALSSYEIDTSLFFTFDCSLTEFAIQSVWDTYGGRKLSADDYENLFELNTASGLLKLKKFNM